MNDITDLVLKNRNELLKNKKIRSFQNNIKKISVKKQT